MISTKKILSLLLAAFMIFSLSACGQEAASTETELPDDGVQEEPVTAAVELPEVSVYVLSGPTGIGAVNLMAAAEAGETVGHYVFTVPGANDEVVAAISQGTADIAAVATNLAAALYNKTQGGVTVLAVNTLGVLSILSNGEEFASISELKGKTIYSPGQGANPEYVLRYVLSQNGLDPDSDVEVRFVAEGSELMTVWATEPEALLLAPQPAATSILMNNEGAFAAFDMTEEWNAASAGESTLMMGCVIVRNEFLQENPDAVDVFLREYRASIEAAQTDTETTAQLCENYGLIAKAVLAKKALPSCGIVCVEGEEMMQQLAGYLQVMFAANPKSVGGALPNADFYYGA